MLFRQVIAGEFAETKKARVLRNRIKPHAQTKLLEKHVVRMRHRIRQIHILAVAHLEHGVARDDIFFQRSKSDRRLDRRARNVALAERNLLIYDRQDAASVRIDSDN